MSKKFNHPSVAPTEEAEKKHTKIAMHAVTQFFGDSKVITPFSDKKIDTLLQVQKQSFPVDNDKHPDRPISYGVVLNQCQMQVFEGILKAYSESNYEGSEEINKNEYNKNHYPINKIEKAYDNIYKIPILKITLAQLIKLSGYNQASQSDKADVAEAINFLATKQFCFYWLRLETKNSKPVKDKNGGYAKEEVMEVGSLLRVQYVRSKAERLQHYIIHPTAPLLDQIDKYFLLVPYDWREEVKKLTGKRTSSYTYEFLFWLRLQYEHIRRYNKNSGKKKPKPFELSRNWEEIATTLKMPESMYKANRKRAFKIVQDAYAVAIELGYLVKVEANGSVDVLHLNESYYPKPGKLV